MKIIQRLGSESQYQEAYIDGLLRLKKQYPRSYNDVWLATDYGFPPLRAFRRDSESGGTPKAFPFGEGFAFLRALRRGSKAPSGRELAPLGD